MRKPTPPVLDRLDLARNEDGNANHNGSEGDGRSPKRPLRRGHVADVGGVHTEEGGDEGKGEENDGDNGENEDGAFLPVAVGFNAVEILDEDTENG